MLKETIINECIKDGKLNTFKCSSSWMNKHQDIKTYLDEHFYDSNTYTEKLYRLYHNLNEKPKCKCGCGNFTKFYRFNKGYRDFYSYKCIQNYSEIKEKIKNTFINHYGTNKLMSIPEIQQKYKQTCLERYNVEHPLKSKIIQEKIKNNNQKQFGIDYLITSDLCKEKSKQTCLERYGVDNFAKTNDYKEKYKQTCLERYGVDNVSKLPEIIDKINKVKLNNKSFNKSKIEDEIYLLLKQNLLMF